MIYYHPFWSSCFRNKGYIYASVSDLSFPRICLPIWLQQNRQTDLGNIQIAYRYMAVEIGQNLTTYLNPGVEVRCIVFVNWQFLIL
jgi:hypothetical protein